MGSRHRFVAAVLAVAGLWACGSKETDSPTSSAATGATGASTSTSSGTMGTGGSGGGGVGGAGATGSTVGATTTTGTGPATATATAATGSTTAATSGAGGGKEIPCGMTTCADYCCISIAASQCGVSPEDCKSKGLSPLACADETDCEGSDVCCLVMDMKTFSAEGKCAASCPYTPFASYQLCTDTKECPTGQTCKIFKVGSQNSPFTACQP
jgi:hypothetical protein